MPTTTAKIAALNKVDNTGITPEISRRLYDSLGKSQIAVVEFVSSERTEGVDDSHAVKLEIKHVEPSDDDDTTEHLRELQRALYRKRNPQPALTADVAHEPGVDGIVWQGKVHLRCPSCNGKWKASGIAHAPGHVADGYAPCTWRQCGHVVTDTDACQRDHDDD